MVLSRRQAKNQQTTENKVSQMFKYSSDKGVDSEKRLQAANNLVVLSRDESGIVRILANDGIGRLKTMLNDKDPQVSSFIQRLWPKGTARV